jgi:hypothetical protein
MTFAVFSVASQGINKTEGVPVPLVSLSNRDLLYRLQGNYYDLCYCAHVKAMHIERKMSEVVH